MKTIRCSLIALCWLPLLALPRFAQSAAPVANNLPQTASAVSFAVIPPRKDDQFWSENHLIKQLTKKVALDVIGVVRIGREWHRPVDERIGAGIAFKVNKYLTAMPTYLYVDYQPYEGRRISEHRLVMNVTGKASVAKWNFTDRNLIERRLRHGSADFTVYRNRLQIDLPWHISTLKLRPFVADEVWHSTQTISGQNAGWYRNRIAAGISKQLTPHVYGELFYLMQQDSKSRPGNLNTVGTLLKYTL